MKKGTYFDKLKQRRKDKRKKLFKRIDKEKLRFKAGRIEKR